MRTISLLLPVLLLTACGGAGPQDLVSKKLDAHLIQRAQELLPQLEQRTGGGGHGGNDGNLNSQYDRRLATREAVEPAAYQALLSTLKKDVEAWLEERGYRIAARGTTGGTDGSPLERFDLRFEGKGAVGWVFADGVRAEGGRFVLLFSLAEHR